MNVAEKYGIRGLQDARHKMYRRSTPSPGRWRPLNEKRGVIVHYAGPAQPIDQYSDMELWQSYSEYHAQPGRFGSTVADGIQYHVGIDRDGGKHLLTDIELDRWHCGAWPENGVALAINLPIGGSQRATEAQVTALTEVVDDWIAGGHGDKSDVKGHQEVDGTACPGTLMEDFVLPYREGIMTTDKGMWFPQTEKYVGGGFWEFFSQNGNVAFFGYPQTDEFTADVDGTERTVQVFERAVFGFYPEDKPHGVPPGHPMRVRMLTLSEAIAVQQWAADAGIL